MTNPSAIDLASLDGTSGFQLVGISYVSGRGSGYYANGVGGDIAAVGDVNGDGIDDLLVGNGLGQETYIILGGAEFASRSVLSARSSQEWLISIDNGTNEANDVGQIHHVFPVGDLNNDGINDLILSGPSKSSTGFMHLFFGRSDWSQSNLSVYGTDTDADIDINRDDAPSPVGDVNGDGIDDLLLGAKLIYGGESAILSSGQINLRRDFDVEFTAETIIESTSRYGPHTTVYATAAAGDVNGDGLADFAIAARPDGPTAEVFVVFGDTEFADEVDLDLLDGMNGFTIEGIDSLIDSRDPPIHRGLFLSGDGDFNGDGFTDLLIGSDFSSGASGPDAGAAFVIYGSADGFDARFDVGSIDGSNGLRIVGGDADSQAGLWSTYVGDFNADGLDDILVGSIRGDTRAGEWHARSHVIYGTRTAATEIRLDQLDGSDGFSIDHQVQDSPYFYRGVTNVSAAGDLNDDGFDDIAFGYPRAIGETIAPLPREDNYYSSGGNVSVLYGFATDLSLTGTPGVDLLEGGPGDDLLRGIGSGDLVRGFAGEDRLLGGFGDDVLRGHSSDDRLIGGAGDDTLTGDGGMDRLVGGSGDDILDGGAGRDVATGGGGADSFVFADGDFDSTADDRITDFDASEGAVIDLTGIDAIMGGGDDAFTFIADSAFSGTAGEMRFVASTITRIQGDTDGDGRADFTIRLNGATTLVEGDFVL